MSDQIVFRSDAPQVIEAWTDAVAEINAYVKQTQAVLDAAGLGRYQVYRRNSGWSPGRFAGLAVPQGEIPPVGWRQSAGREYAVPDKRVKAGRLVAAALDAVKHPGDPRFKLVGMPPDAGFSSPGVRLMEDRTALYVTWNADPDGRESFFTGTARVDHDLWKRIPLSAYYTEVERFEAAKGARDEVNAA